MMQRNPWLDLNTTGYGSDSGEGPTTQLSPDYLKNYTFDPNADAPNAGKGLYSLKRDVQMPQDFMQRFGGAIPTGPMTLADLVKYTGGENNGVTAGEFGQLHPKVQQAILNDPATFLKGQMGYNYTPPTRTLSGLTDTNNPFAKYGVSQNRGGSNDLLSVGAEGGSRDLSRVGWKPGVGLVQSPSNYKAVNDTNWIDYTPLLIGGAAGLAGMAPVVVGGATGATMSGAKDGADFTDFLKGGLIGAGTAYLGQNIGGLASDTVGYNPTIADATWSAGATPLSQWGSQVGQGALTGAIKGGAGSLLNGGNVWEGALKGGFSGGVGTGIGSGVNSAGLSPGWSNALKSGGNWATGALTNSFFGNSQTQNNPQAQSNNSQGGFWNSGNNSNGGNMANDSFDWGSLAGGIQPFLSAWQTNKNAGQTDQAYNDARNLILNPSPDQQKYRGQLSELMSNPGSMSTSPLYQSMVDQGMNMVNRTAAANGQLGSGNRLADLMKQGQQTAAQYYFPQQQALAGLSGIGNDSGNRALGAESLISGNNAQMALKNNMLSDLMSGFGAKTQQQKMIDALIGNNGGNNGGGGTSLLGQAANAVKGWFGGDSGGYAPGDYAGFNSSINPSLSSWDSYLPSSSSNSWFGGSGPTIPQTNWYGGGTGGTSTQDLFGASASGGSGINNFNSWKLY